MTGKTILHGERITKDPEILAGKPIITGTRVPVSLVLAKLARNPDLAELFADYPHLTLNDVKACLEYANVLVQREERAKGPGTRRELGHASP